MELRHLRYFVAVAETENVTRAARKLHVSQPGLSRQIRDLEDELRFALLERTAKSVSLTDAGRTFLVEAREVLLRVDEAVKAARAVATGQRGEIHVGYAPTPTVELLPCALHAFQNIAPEVRVNLHDLTTGEMLRGLTDGKLDICLMVRPSAKSSRGFTFELLRQYPMCAAFHPGHRFARKKRIEIRDLMDCDLIAYSRTEYPEYHTMLENLFADAPARPRIAEEHDSAPGLIAALEVGRGVAVVPSSLAILTGGRLKMRPLHPSPPALEVMAAFNPDRFSPAAKQFLAAAQKAKALRGRHPARKPG